VRSHSSGATAASTHPKQAANICGNITHAKTCVRHEDGSVVVLTCVPNWKPDGEQCAPLAAGCPSSIAHATSCLRYEDGTVVVQSCSPSSWKPDGERCVSRTNSNRTANSTTPASQGAQKQKVTSNNAPTKKSSPRQYTVKIVSCSSVHVAHGKKCENVGGLIVVAKCVTPGYKVNASQTGCDAAASGRKKTPPKQSAPAKLSCTATFTNTSTRTTLGGTVTATYKNVGGATMPANHYSADLEFSGGSNVNAQIGLKAMSSSWLPAIPAGKSVTKSAVLGPFDKINSKQPATLTLDARAVPLGGGPNQITCGVSPQWSIK
jgi:hypothetical protein